MMKKAEFEGKISSARESGSVRASVARYGVFGYCLVDKVHAVVVANTISNILLCRGCKHFREVSK
jgi:hypothetical protein